MMRRACVSVCVVVLLIAFDVARGGSVIPPDDADAKTAQRWQLDNGAIRVEFDAGTGRMNVLDKQAGYTWRQPAPPDRRPDQKGPTFRNVRKLDRGAVGVVLETDLGVTNGKPNTVTVTLAMPEETGRLDITLDMPDRNTEAHYPSFWHPFILDTPRGVMAIPDYCNGHVYPLDDFPDRHPWLWLDRLDMPWVGLCDLERGFGWLMIIDTPDNGQVHLSPYDVGGRKLVAPRVHWHSSKRLFEHPRKLTCHFVPRGGYVAMAKVFRAWARERGLLVTLAEKARRNANVKRLLGAPIVWGDARLDFAQQAKLAGIDRMLVNGRSSPDQTRAINELGYLTGEYDNYTDILPLEPGKQIDKNHAPLPDHAVLNADGKRMTAWLTIDKKKQYMKRCPALWTKAAKIVVPKALRDVPFLARFMDVTTAEGLYECFDPKHPLTKRQKRRCGVDLLSYVRSNRLVVGAEHGIWWAVPYVDYFEGMMSGTHCYYSWPAGHLIRPESRDQRFTNPWGRKLPPFEMYETWGIGHAWRAPLWELVFHDCVITTWYWGDTNGWLHAIAPELTAKKDAFNILYGTVPMIWANKNGLWQTDRQAALRTYRTTCKLHEAVAGTEMLTHEFLTSDHHVQRTRFSDGTIAVVNFGLEPQWVDLAGESHLLPQNGFAVKGPAVEQHRRIEDDHVATRIKRPDYVYEQRGAREVELSRQSPTRLRLYVGKDEDATVEVRPADVAPDWDLITTQVYRLDEQGGRSAQAEFDRHGPDWLFITVPETPATFELICGHRARAAGTQPAWR